MASKLRHLDEKIKIVWLMPELGFILLAWLVLSGASIFFLGGFDLIAIAEIFVGLALVVGIPSYVWIHLTHENFTYELGEHELVIHEGVITKHRSVIPFGRIQNITTERTMFERMLGLATLKIETAAHVQGMTEAMLPGIANREELIAELLGHVERTKKASGLGPEPELASDEGAATLLDILTELREIKEVLRKGKEPERAEDKISKFTSMHVSVPEGEGHVVPPRVADIPPRQRAEELRGKPRSMSEFLEKFRKRKGKKRK